MEKKRSFLGFLASLFVIFFVGNALAEGYTCPEQKKYTSCNAGFYLTGSDTGNACVDCTTASNTTATQACSSEVAITNGKRVSSGTQSCTGKFTGGNGGTTVGTSTCTGCDSWGTCNYTSYACNCEPGYHASGTDASCTCVSDCSTSKACSTLGSEWSGTYNECTANQSSQCSKSCSVICSGNATCPTNATCTWNTSYSYTGTQYYGGTCNATAGTCPILTFTCNPGFSKNAAGTECVANSYTITYKNGGGTGADQSQSVTYKSAFTTKASSIFTRPGYTFLSWGGDYPNPNSNYTYNTAGNTTLTAQWNACTNAPTAPGTCNCGTTQYPNGSGCAACAVSCNGVSGFTLGTYNVCQSQTDSICYRNCTTSDVANSSSVSGTVTKGGTTTCAATACADTYYVSGAGCKKCPANSDTCGTDGDPDDFTCKPGYTKTSDSCEPQTYTVTYSCGDGSGTKPSNATATYNTGFTPANNTCTRENWVFNGWLISGTSTIKHSGATFTWTYLESKTFTAQWVQTAGNCTTGEYYNGTSCQTCPPGYTSDIGATAQNECYKECTTNCVAGDPNSCLDGTATKCEYNTDDTLSGIQYYGSSECVVSGPKTCSIKRMYCNPNYYADSDTMTCKLCRTLGNGSWPDSYGGYPSNGATVCMLNDCSAECTPRECPTNSATCTVNTTDTKAGYIKYPNTTCAIKAGLNRYCSDTFTCGAGYTKTANASNASSMGSCDPIIYTITLNDGDGSGGLGAVYQKYATGWYSDDTATTTINKVVIPTRPQHTFIGYFDAQTGGNKYIDATGQLPSNASFTENITLYAQYSQDVYKCTAGQTSTGAACPAGKYCPGGDVPSGEEAGANGCARACPPDARGGTLNSAGDRTSITDCTATRNNVALSDNSGKADQTCFYSTSSSAYDNKCTIRITACNPGNYRQSESATTCASCEIGAYCPGQELTKYLCSDLSGANDTTTTKGTNSVSATACYNTCDSISIANGSRVPVDDEIYYAGSAIPACQYTTSCNPGYDISGQTCTPHVYTITLNHNGGTSSANTIYLKYDNGWYSTKTAAGADKITTVAIPDYAGKTFSGYVSTAGVVVIDPTGKLTNNLQAFTNDATITAQWNQNATITCAAGTYYTGTGSTCTDCPAGSYCIGTTAIRDIRTESGKATCASLNGTYTSAAGLTTTITSAARAPSAESCYATNLAYMSPTNTGSGNQTCYYDASKRSYSGRCTNKVITACVKGHYRANASDDDCTQVGQGYYSPDDAITRTACPNLGTTDGVTTQSTTSEKVTQCYLGNIWYEPTGGHSGHRRSCYHVENASITDITTGYSYNCDVSVIVVCDAGYWDDGTYENSAGERDCAPVGNNYFSPEQSFFTEEPSRPNQTTPGSSTKRTACPNNGLTSITTAARNTACYQNCPAKTIENGTTTASPATVQYTGTTYPACKYIATCAGGFTSKTAATPTENPMCQECPAGYVCPPNSSDEPQKCPDTHPNTAPGAANRNECYRDCALAENAATMSGHDYLGGSTCAIATCMPGSYLSNGLCANCPAGKVCNGGTTPPSDCPADHYCPDGTDEPQKCPDEYPHSPTNTGNVNACYRECVAADVANATSVVGTLTRGGVNTCAATACAAGTYLENGKCVTCPAGKVCNGGTTPPSDCPADHYCPDGTDEPFACPETHPKSASNTANRDGCYAECAVQSLDGGSAIPNAPRVFHPNQCEYTGKSDTGNPCEIDFDAGTCTETYCNSDFELIGGRCRPCNRENALSYRPEGNCMVASCATGYHPNGERCDENVRECPAPNAVLAQQTWDYSKNTFSVCTIKECETGYHIASNACVLDERECVVEHGIGTQEWNSASNSWGECIATRCEPGYTNDPYETNERTKQCGQCKNKFAVNGEQAASTYIQGCEIASCMYQGEMYNLENNECVPICSVSGREDETGYMKWDAARKKCVRTCKDGYTSW